MATNPAQPEDTDGMGPGDGVGLVDPRAIHPGPGRALPEVDPLPRPGPGVKQGPHPPPSADDPGTPASGLVDPRAEIPDPL